MGLFDRFMPTPPQQAAPNAVLPGQQPVPGQTVPGNIPPVDPNAPAPTGLDANGQPLVVAEPVVPDSPLDQFKNLWETVPLDPNNPAVVEQKPLTAEAVQEVMKNANFTPQITDEQRAAITAGGEGATEAFNAALNSVAQQVMVQSTLVGNKLNENQIKQAIEKHMSTLPEMLRLQSSTQHLKDSNPLFDNPAIKPVIAATQAQLLQKFPNATDAEITTMAQEFVVAMGESFNPAVTSDVPEGEDWTKFVE